MSRVRCMRPASRSDKTTKGAIYDRSRASTVGARVCHQASRSDQTQCNRRFLCQSAQVCRRTNVREKKINTGESRTLDLDLFEEKGPKSYSLTKHFGPKTVCLQPGCPNPCLFFSTFLFFDPQVKTRHKVSKPSWRLNDTGYHPTTHCRLVQRPAACNAKESASISRLYLPKQRGLA